MGTRERYTDLGSKISIIEGTRGQGGQGGQGRGTRRERDVPWRASAAGGSPSVGDWRHVSTVKTSHFPLIKKRIFEVGELFRQA